MPKKTLDMLLIRVFQMVLRGRRRNLPLVDEEWGILLGVDLFISGLRLRKRAFDHSSLFQNKKHHFINIEHQLKLKLA